jgi:dienelactone hydrolase
MMKRFLVALCLVCSASASVQAEVTRWEVTKREPYAEGRPRGERGSYERWTGKVHFTIDPQREANRVIVDLEHAPRNANGQVEFSADFEMLVPKDRSQSNGAVFYEVNNRGNKTATSILDGGADDFLCRQGYVVLWSGWIAEVQPGGSKVRLQAPVATENGQPIRGIVRNEVIVDQATPRASISHRGNQGSYRPAPGAVPTLTRREREADARQAVAKEDWKLIIRDVAGGQLPLIELEVAGGLKPGWIYEVIYEAEGPVVQGVGLAGIRDIISSLKYGSTNETNPLLSEANKKPLVTRSLGFGTSQSGRCLRHFLWQGFNADERGRQVFDGVISHVAGGGLGSFNHRFASPTRTNGQHEEHTFPADQFPFAYGDEQDPFTGKTDGILRKARETKTTPKLFHTQTSSEYWHRSGSLVHTDPTGKKDSEIPPEVRLYTFGGTQHGPGSGFPGAKGGGTQPSNPADYRPLMRGLLLALDAWVKDGVEPPPSVYPRLSDGTLVGWKREQSGWPHVPSVTYPQVIQQPVVANRGPQWESAGIATIEPPEIKGHYEVKVPRSGPDGNERGTLNLPAIEVPVASYTSWNLRDESIGAAGELLSLQGSYIPLPRTQAERAAAKDHRPALETLYSSFEDYEAKYLAAAERLVKARYLLREDVPRLKALCAKFRPVFEKGEKKAAVSERQGVPFDLQALARPPEMFPTDIAKAEGVQTFFYEGPKYRGKPTKVFAYYGKPEQGAGKAGEKLPAMVLIHGGGGTAFDRWVKVWTARGYAAIAMDLCGCVPVGTYGKWQRHEEGGPAGWGASLQQLDEAPEDQWTHQAVSAALLAHSLLRSFPEIDPERIGVTGISWGGYLTSIVAGVDARFQFAAPVYGCGFLGDNSAWLADFQKLGPERAQLWLNRWDPSAYLPAAKMPILWVNGTNDFAYPMDSWQKSYRLPQSPHTLCLRVRMPHGHGPAGENPEEIHVFANATLRGGKPLPVITGQGEAEGKVWATFKSDVPLMKAELTYTRDAGKWQDRKWETEAAELDAEGQRVSAAVPDGATVFYLNLFDTRNCVVSTEHVARP